MQTDYAENFVTAMLSWMRYIASNIAKMLRGGTGAGGGSLLLRWFRGNWLGILIFLIVAGLVLDFLIWMIRWRPYWLWFRKKRVLLDDDIDKELTDRQLYSRFDKMGVRVPKDEMVFPDSEDETDIRPVRMKKKKTKSFEVPKETLDFFEEDDK